MREFFVSDEDASDKFNFNLTPPNSSILTLLTLLMPTKELAFGTDSAPTPANYAV